MFWINSRGATLTENGVSLSATGPKGPSDEIVLTR
jgi:hypothetical protein